MSINVVDIVNADVLEKVVLTQRVSCFLKDDCADDERSAIENVARMLAQDISIQVREALAFELRICKKLPHDLAAKIASDVESVASPFLATTEALSDTQLAGLLPHLEEHAHVTLARRSDLGPHTCHAIVTLGTEKSVSFVVRNSSVTLRENTCRTVMKRFADSSKMMDLLSCRADLPLALVDGLVALVSDEYKSILTTKYNLSEEVADKITQDSQSAVIWQQVSFANPQQIHAYVIDLKKSCRLSHEMTLEMLERGCLNFLESMLALDAGLTLAAVRQSLYSKDMADFVRLMQQANVSQLFAKKYRKIVALKGDFSS
ncbi:MAG: DUF2336 domain-containing protein [Kordiimonadaceae bacterium]|nr:DUF2336 domain-containing protein [Kordiimonadaceae bacterium]